MEEQPITLDNDSDGNVILSLPSGHEETLTPDKAELLAFGLLDMIKDEWPDAQ